MNNDEKKRLKRILFELLDRRVADGRFSNTFNLACHIENLFDEPGGKEELTAKELVRRIGCMQHEMKGGVDEDYNQGMKAMYAIFKKEAGL